MRSISSMSVVKGNYRNTITMTVENTTYNQLDELSLLDSTKKNYNQMCDSKGCRRQTLTH